MISTKLSYNEKGFAHLLSIAAVIVVVAATAFVGYKIVGSSSANRPAGEAGCTARTKVDVRTTMTASPAPTKGGSSSYEFKLKNNSRCTATYRLIVRAESKYDDTLAETKKVNVLISPSSEKTAAIKFKVPKASADAFKNPTQVWMLAMPVEADAVTQNNFATKQFKL